MSFRVKPTIVPVPEEAKTAVQRKICVIIGRNRIVVPRTKSPRYASRSATHIVKTVHQIWTRANIRTGFLVLTGGGDVGRSGGNVRVFRFVLLFFSEGEEAGDHLFQRRVLDADVEDGVIGEDVGQHVGNLAAIDVDLRRRGGAISRISPKRAKSLGIRSSAKSTVRIL